LGSFSHPSFHRQIPLTFSMREAHTPDEWSSLFLKIFP
jgi:hypothetical protein